MSCQITMASDARTQTSFVFKFCVGSRQDLTHKLSTASAFLNFVSDPINIRNKKNKACCVAKFCVGSHQQPKKKKQSRLCFQVLCRIPSTSDTKIKACCVSKFHVGSKFCVGSHQHPTQKNKAGGVSTFWIESHQPLTQKWKLPSFKCRLKNLCVSTFCVGSHQDPTQNENYLVTCIPRTFGGDHVFLEALDKSAIQKLQRGETNLSQIPSGQTQEF